MKSKFKKAIFAVAASVITFAAFPEMASAQMYGPNYYPMMPPPHMYSVPRYMPPPPPAPVYMPAPIYAPPPVYRGPIYAPPPVYRGPMQPSPPIHPGRAIAYNAVGMNHELQVGAECAYRYGVSKAAAGCIVGRLTADEINKCFTDGIGGRGCFGDNNTLVGWARNNFAAAQHETTLFNQGVRATTGISIGAIQQNGVLGGEGSDLRKGCDALAGLVGGRC